MLSVLALVPNCGGSDSQRGATEDDAGSSPEAGDGVVGVDGGNDTSIDGAGSDGAGTPTCTADLQTSPDNCGRCLHGCLGGACVAGICQPVTLKTNVTVAGGRLLMDADAVYFHDRLVDNSHWDVVRVTFSGDSSTVLAAYPFSYLFLDLVGDDLYFNDSSGEAYVRMPKTGGPLSPVLAQRVASPVFTSSSLYGLTAVPYASTLWRAPFGGGTAGTPVTMVGTGLDLPRFLTLGRGALYIADSFNGIVYAVSTTAPALKTIASSESWPIGLAADGDEVFWLDQGTSQVGKNAYGGLVHFATGQAQPDILVDHISDTPQGLAVTATDLVWITAGASVFAPGPPAGRLMSLRRNGGTPRTLATALALPEAVVADARRICWLENGPAARDGTGVIQGAGSLRCMARP